MEGGGRCIAAGSSATDDWCKSNCIPGPCTETICDAIGSTYCKWEYSDPCEAKPCKNGGTCSAKKTDGTYTISCDCKTATGCYKNSTGSHCEIVNITSGCDGGAGCTINSSCIGVCDSKCYSLNESTCKLNGCSSCDEGVCVCGDDGPVCKQVPSKYLIGYYCPTCPSNKIATLVELINTKYNIIIMSFINVTIAGNLNVVSNSNNCWGAVTGVPSATPVNVCPTKENITKLKTNNKIILGSIGGGAAPYIYSDYIKQSFINNFVSDAITLIQEYNLDGIDFDIENRRNDYEIIGLAFREIARQVKAAGYIVCGAPQCSNLGGCTGAVGSINAGTNEVVSMYGYPSKSVTFNDIRFDKDALFDNPFWLVFPQMYNTGPLVEQPESIVNYWTTMTSKKISFTGKYTTYNVTFDSSNFSVGFPASSEGASSGYRKPDIIVEDILKKLPKLRGVMTWSIGWDLQNKSTFETIIGTYLGLKT